jgi:hypothetical protein
MHSFRLVGRRSPVTHLKRCVRSQSTLAERLTRHLTYNTDDELQPSSNSSAVHAIGADAVTGTIDRTLGHPLGSPGLTKQARRKLRKKEKALTSKLARITSAREVAELLRGHVPHSGKELENSRPSVTEASESAIRNREALIQLLQDRLNAVQNQASRSVAGPSKEAVKKKVTMTKEDCLLGFRDKLSYLRPIGNEQSHMCV